jgi:tetratricopeptide (TPR) repeat protein
VTGWVNAGVVYERLGDLEAAERSYRTALEQGRGTAAAWLASIVRDRDGLDVAIALAQQAVAAGPQSSYPHEELANLLEELGDVDGMMEHLRAADALGHARAAYELACHLEPAEAHAALDRASQRLRDTTDPNWPWIANREKLGREIAEKRASLPKVGTRFTRERLEGH